MRDAAVIACRALSVYAAIRATEGLQAVGTGFGLGFLAADTGDLISNVWILVSTLVPVLLLAALALFLWRRADWLAARMVSPAHAPGPEAAADPDLDAIALSVVGVFVLSQALPRLVQLGINLGVRPSDEIARGIARGTMIIALTVAAQLALGVWLVLGSRRLAGFLRRLRQG